PKIVAICNRTLSPEKIDWYTDNFNSIKQVTSDYKELLANDDVEAVYVAVPHNMHKEIYCDGIEAGKHLLGEKPFGIDLDACESILKSMKSKPNVLVGCASQYIFYPAIQRILEMLEQGKFGQIIEVESGFSHCSDLDTQKPINWKRMVDINGRYGCVGDLGFHNAIMGMRAGWQIQKVRSIFSNIVSQRPNLAGDIVACETYDNASMLAVVLDETNGQTFPWEIKIHRIMPGEQNTWYFNIYGTKGSAVFSLKNPKCLDVLLYEGKEQAWRKLDMGFATPYKTITGSVFEFGSVDAFMQLMAALMYELEHDKPKSFAAACPSPEEMYGCHKLFTAALKSSDNKTVEIV
ncbi:Gfo/Idh/MocA family protein, partial [Planctomycetota bacterium]